MSNPICNHCMRQAFHKEFCASQMERHADPFKKVSPRRAHMPGFQKLNKCATPVQWFKQRLHEAHPFGVQGVCLTMTTDGSMESRLRRGESVQV